MSWILRHFDLVVSVTTIISIEFMIRRKWYAWLLALLNQLVWFTYIMIAGQYGLLLLNVVLLVQNTRGLIAWRVQHKATTHAKAIARPVQHVSRDSENPG